METWLVGYEGEEDRISASAYTQEASCLLGRSLASFSNPNYRAEAEVSNPEIVRRVERYLFSQDRFRGRFMIVTKEYVSYRYERDGTPRVYVECVSRLEVVRRNSPEARGLLKKNFPQTRFFMGRLHVSL